MPWLWCARHSRPCLALDWPRLGVCIRPWPRQYASCPCQQLFQDARQGSQDTCRRFPYALLPSYGLTEQVAITAVASASPNRSANASLSVAALPLTEKPFNVDKASMV